MSEPSRNPELFSYFILNNNNNKVEVTGLVEGVVGELVLPVVLGLSAAPETMPATLCNVWLWPHLTLL